MISLINESAIFIWRIFVLPDSPVTISHRSATGFKTGRLVLPGTFNLQTYEHNPIKSIQNIFFQNFIPNFSVFIIQAKTKHRDFFALQ